MSRHTSDIPHLQPARHNELAVKPNLGGAAADNARARIHLLGVRPLNTVRRPQVRGLQRSREVGVGRRPDDLASPEAMAPVHLVIAYAMGPTRAQPPRHNDAIA